MTLDIFPKPRRKAEPAPVETTPEEPTAAELPEPSAEAMEESAPKRTRRGTRGGRTRSEEAAAAEAAEAPAAEAPVAEEVAEAPAKPVRRTRRTPAKAAAEAAAAEAAAAEAEAAATVPEAVDSVTEEAAQLITEEVIEAAIAGDVPEVIEADADGDVEADGEPGEGQAEAREGEPRRGRERRRGGRGRDRDRERRDPPLADADFSQDDAPQGEQPQQRQPAREPREPREPRDNNRQAAGGPSGSPDALVRAVENQGRQIEQLLRVLQDDRSRRTTSPNGAPPPRLGVFVDVANIELAADRQRVRLDWGRILGMLSRDRQLVRAVAYAPIHDDPSVSVETQRFVEPFLEKGFKIVTKPLKRFQDGSIKANVDIELALDVVAMTERLDVVCLVSGDGDFEKLVELVQGKGVRVEVVSFGSSTAGNLKQAADSFIDLQSRLRDVRV